MSAGQEFAEVNGTSAVPNSDVPSWVVAEAQAAQHRGQSVDVNNRFTIPVSGANPLTSGQQTGEYFILGTTTYPLPAVRTLWCQEGSVRATLL